MLAVPRVTSLTLMRSLVLTLTFATISVHHLVAQRAAEIIETVLVGTRETVQVRIEFHSDARRYDLPWGSIEPISPGMGQPIYLETTLPIKFGTAVLPAGRSQLWTVMLGEVATLVITKALPKGEARFAAAQQLLRVPMAVTRLAEHAEGLFVQIRTTRLSEDTVRIVDRSTHTQTRLVKEIIPGTRTTLSIQLGPWLMTTPIGAK